MPPTVPDGPHTPIRNTSDTEAALTPVATDPFVGAVDSQATPNAAGVETVERPESLEADIDHWVAPDTSKLRDVGVASFGAPPQEVLETLHGPDDRVRITTTAQFPWRVHASLLITAADGSSWVGTAWFIGGHTLATAAHCVYIKNSRRARPRRLGQEHSRDARSGRQDIALWVGDCRPLLHREGLGGQRRSELRLRRHRYSDRAGNKLGWLVSASTPTTSCWRALAMSQVIQAISPKARSGYDTHQIGSVTPSKVYYDIDTMGGQSGSAVYRIVNGKQIAVAIHAYGGATHNSGTRISTPVHANLTQWIDRRRDRTPMAALIEGVVVGAGARNRGCVRLHSIGTGGDNGYCRSTDTRGALHYRCAGSRSITRRELAPTDMRLGPRRSRLQMMPSQRR